jgi:hypothetical protein
MSGPPDYIYTAQRLCNDIEDTCRGSIEELINALVSIKNLQAELKDCENFEEGVDEQLKYSCEDLLRTLAIVREDSDMLASQSNKIFETLGLKAEWDDKREEWHLKGEVYER